MSETATNGVCPFCGVPVEFAERQATLGVDTPVGAAYVRLYQCPRPDCRRAHAVLETGGVWARFPFAEPPDIKGVPEKVMGAFKEAALALAVGAPRAAACMLRRTVASACTDQNIPDEEDGRWVPLQTRIDQLKGKLLPATFSAARAAKLLGDAGAHEEAEERLGDVDADDVRKTIEVVGYFLSNLYERPAKIEELEKPRATEDESLQQ